jgi:DNA-binding IclR family transcriptional regulator
LKLGACAPKFGHGIDAVEVAGAILQALLRCPRLARLKDIEIATGIPSAKIHRYLVSMIRCGLVRRHGGSGRYDFGLLAHQVGQVVTRDNDVVAQIEARLAEFSQHVGEVVGVAHWVGNGVAFVNWFESSPEFSIRLKPGMQLSVTTSATAKLLAAYLAREVTEPLVRSELAERHTEPASRLNSSTGNMPRSARAESRIRWALAAAASTRCRCQFSITTGGSSPRSPRSE